MRRDAWVNMEFKAHEFTVGGCMTQVSPWNGVMAAVWGQGTRVVLYSSLPRSESVQYWRPEILNHDC